jgi:hypothetical protein
MDMIRRIGLLSVLAGFAVAANASPAAATVTIGQIGTPDPGGCAPNNDWVQLVVASGPSYVVPGNGTITSWSTVAKASPGLSMKMKIYRPAGGTSYTVVGHAGPETLSAGQLNTFPASIAVRSGDILGLNSVTSGVGCLITTPGDSVLNGFGDTADNQIEDFPAPPFPDYLLDISAVFDPTNSFSLGGITRNKKKGTATITVTVPNPGELTGSGNGAKVASDGRAMISKSVGAGQAKLLIKAQGKKKRKLNETGKVKLNVGITYTPTGGSSATQSVKVKLKKKLKR